MSNLIKSVYFNMNPEGMRVVDSDSQVEQFIPDFFQKPEEKVFAQGLPVDDETEGSSGFQAGMHVLNMEDVRQEEREKVTKETSEQVEQMLSEARREADGIIRQAQEEAQDIRNQAYEDGKAQGLTEGQELAAQELQQQKSQFQQEMEQKRRELEEQALALEPQFADIVAALVEKITGVLCQDKKEIIVYLIHQALNQLEKTKQITLRVSKEDMILVSSHKGEFKNCVSPDVEFDVVEDESLGASQCIIETDNKIIDCSLDVQLKNVQDQIKMLTIL